ncbi:hypothetical protein PoB_002939300 [Plakobranchus ocellatus]|uniref:Uncharacterized protein n=1 Tax=Plakobranchus ocellatus TaxID=259542 RepID=A0AAV4A6S0_9GAST|nr:hypothetical protein PoB_002939300 [Plakobranchus ocellatus]
MVSDGDSKAFNKLVEIEPYGPNTLAVTGSDEDHGFPPVRHRWLNGRGNGVADAADVFSDGWYKNLKIILPLLPSDLPQVFTSQVEST